MNTDYERLGQAIRTARRDHLLTQEKLAEKVGISASFLGHIERGTRKASLETLCGISRELTLDLNLALDMPIPTDGFSKRAMLEKIIEVLMRHHTEW